MKFMLMPKEPSWWTWTSLMVLQFVGLAGWTPAFVLAIALAMLQTAYYQDTFRSWRHYAVQVRLAYAVLMLVSIPPALHWLYWLPALGTAALVTFGYCLLARTLSVLPWNSDQPLSFELLQRAFLTPPVAWQMAELPTDTGCPGGVCVLEARAKEIYHNKTKPI